MENQDGAEHKEMDKFRRGMISEIFDGANLKIRCS